MGQVLKREIERRDGKDGFRDLSELPPEVSLAVLSHLNATDLCLAACVWESLACDEILWKGLCHESWGHVSIYKSPNRVKSFRRLYLQLDEATLTFNADPFEGIKYLFTHRLLEDSPDEIAKFIHSTKLLNDQKKKDFLQERDDILERLINYQSFENQFLPNALRKFFKAIHVPTTRGEYLSQLVGTFTDRFCACNPDLHLSRESVFIICFSLIMLSVDLCSPHVKNKMSKREFIRNTRGAATDLDGELAGHLYDNIYLVGHVAPEGEG